VFVPREQVLEQIKGRGVAVDDKNSESAVATELDGIRKSLMTMLLVEKESHITVQAVTFPKAKAVEEPVALSPVAQIWPKHGKTIVLGTLSLVAFFLLWRMVKKPVEVVIGPGPNYEDEQLLAGTEIPGAVRAGKMEQKVTEMVRKNPGEAASLVSRWVQSEG
jgi:flagellar biosynthesis/type III secretory pathway M-ring protein FliF/YscJ